MGRFISESSLSRWVGNCIDCLPPSTENNGIELIKDTIEHNNDLRYFVTFNSNWNIKALNSVKNIRIFKDNITDLLFYGLENGIHENNDIYHYMDDNTVIFDLGTED